MRRPLRSSGRCRPPARRAITLITENGRWEHEGQRYFDGEVEPCINGRTVGIVAVDPSSPFSGGAILGDRVRMTEISGDPGVFAMAAAVFEAMEDRPDWQALSVSVLPGITAMLAAAARAGAPLGHDFAAINLSDNLKPFELVEKRLRLAAQADFAMAFYNPRSKSRPHQFARVLDILREECEPERLILFARAVSTPEEEIRCVSLGEATPEMADMRTMVIVGNSATRRVGPHIYTPRRA